MAVYAGYGGSVTFNAVDLEAQRWELTTSVDLIDATTLGNTNRVYTAGLKDWRATVECFQKTETDTIAYVSTTATLELYIDDTHKFSGKGICTNARITSDRNDKKKLVLEFEGNEQTATIAFS